MDEGASPPYCDLMMPGDNPRPCGGVDVCSNVGDPCHWKDTAGWHTGTCAMLVTGPASVIPPWGPAMGCRGFASNPQAYPGVAPGITSLAIDSLFCYDEPQTPPPRPQPRQLRRPPRQPRCLLACLRLSTSLKSHFFGQITRSRSITRRPTFSLPTLEPWCWRDIRRGSACPDERQFEQQRR